MTQGDVSAGSATGAGAQDPSHLRRDWPARIIDAALTLHAVSAGAAKVLIQALEGSARDRPLKNKELATLANELIAASDASPSKGAPP
jgi:hypothetical protein